MTTSSRAAPGRVPPGPPHQLTNLRMVMRDRLQMMRSGVDTYGDAVRFRVGPKTLYLFNHPDHARHILSQHPEHFRKGLGLVHAKRALGDGLLTSDGERWRAQRSTVQPAFGRDRVVDAADVVVDEMARVLARWRAHPGEQTDLVTEMTQLTLGVLGRALLKVDLGTSASIGRAFEVVQAQAMFEMSTLSAVPSWLPLPRQWRFRRARRMLDRLVDGLVSAHGAVPDHPDEADDLLARLVAAAREETDPRTRRRRLREELVTLLLAGHETTASTLGWTWYLVSRTPEVFDRLHEEAVSVLGDRRPTYDDLGRLSYTTQVVQEAVRLYPPVWMLPRISRQPDTIGGYDVPAGADVLICLYTLHRHPEFWDRPEEFDPGRFSPDRAADRPRYAYLPFGAGPRFCVGSNLGLAEAVLVVAMTAREFRLERVSSAPVTPEPMLSLRLRGGLPVIPRAV